MDSFYKYLQDNNIAEFYEDDSGGYRFRAGDDNLVYCSTPEASFSLDIDDFWLGNVEVAIRQHSVQLNANVLPTTGHEWITNISVYMNDYILYNPINRLRLHSFTDKKFIDCVETTLNYIRYMNELELKERRS